MPERTDSESRKLLKRLRDTLAAPGDGQARLDSITHHIADSMGTQVCSIYLFRDPDTLELCATEGLRLQAVHKTRLRLGEGLVGRVARTGPDSFTFAIRRLQGSVQGGDGDLDRFVPLAVDEVLHRTVGIVERLDHLLRIDRQRGVQA